MQQAASCKLACEISPLALRRRANQRPAGFSPATISKSAGPPIPLFRSGCPCLAPTSRVFASPAWPRYPQHPAGFSPIASKSQVFPKSSPQILRGSYFFRLYPIRGTFHSLAEQSARLGGISYSPGKAKQATPKVCTSRASTFAHPSRALTIHIALAIDTRHHRDHHRRILTATSTLIHLTSRRHCRQRLRSPSIVPTLIVADVALPSHQPTTRHPPLCSE